MIFAEDERQEFIDEYVKNVFDGLKPSDHPEFAAIIGAQGSGKSTLAREMDNYAKVSSDDIVLKCVETAGIDVREDYWSEELRAIANETTKKIVSEGIKNNFNILYEASDFDKFLPFMNKVADMGYDTTVKAIVADEYLAALNVEERNLSTRERINVFKQGKIPYPDIHPFEIMAETSMQSSLKIIDAIRDIDNSDINLEVYEFGKTSPGYVKGVTHNSFEDFAGNIELPDIQESVRRAETLKNKAKNSGNEDVFLRISALQKEMKSM